MQNITTLRRALGLSQVEFGQLFDAHSMTVSKWDRGLLRPTAYQIALMRQFQATAEAKQDQSREQVKNLLVGAPAVHDIQMKVSNGKLLTAAHAGHWELAEFWFDVRTDDSACYATSVYRGFRP